MTDLNDLSHPNDQRNEIAIKGKEL